MDVGQQFLRTIDKRHSVILFVSLFLILIGSRAIVINHDGNSTPFWDEWDGDAANLLLPYLRGNLALGDLFSRHNEHIIFFTRLLTLAIFTLSGYWDVILQMIANAFLAYKLPYGFGVGIGPNFIGHQFANDEDTLHFPSEIQLDGYITYTPNKRWDVRLNITNMTNARLLDPIDVSFEGNDSEFVRPPISASITIRTHF